MFIQHLIELRLSVLWFDVPTAIRMSVLVDWNVQAEESELVALLRNVALLVDPLDLFVLKKSVVRIAASVVDQ